MNHIVDVVQIFVASEADLQRGEAVLASDSLIDAEAFVEVAVLVAVAA